VDRLRRTVQFDATVSGVVATYLWDFGGGITQSVPGAGSPTTSREFGPGSHTVTLTTAGPGSCTDKKDVTFTVNACCPQVTDISVAEGDCDAAGTHRAIGLTAQVAGSGVTSYTWDFGDQTTFGPPGAASPPPHLYTAPSSPTVTVTASTPGCPDSTVTKQINVPACPGGSTGGPPFQLPDWVCAIFLVLALIFLAIALITAFLAGCTLAAGNPVGAGIIIAAVAAFVLFLLFIGLWGAFCAFSHCGILCALISTVTTLIGIAAIALIVLAALGNPCFLGAIFDGGYLGLVPVSLRGRRAGVKIGPGCPPTPALLWAVSPRISLALGLRP
jgi:hypothetical protein